MTYTTESIDGLLGAFAEEFDRLSLSEELDSLGDIDSEELNRTIDKHDLTVWEHPYTPWGHYTVYMHDDDYQEFRNLGWWDWSQLMELDFGLLGQVYEKAKDSHEYAEFEEHYRKHGGAAFYDMSDPMERHAALMDVIESNYTPLTYKEKQILHNLLSRRGLDELTKLPPKSERLPKL